MVDNDGQIYTIEGVSAAILMVVTVYLVVTTTTVLTPQDVHIIDMQLQQLGSDALAMMDTPDTYGSQSVLTKAVLTNSPDLFRENFLGYINNTTNVGTSGYDQFNYTATLYYQNVSDQISKTPFGGGTYYRENAVKVSRWVYLPYFVNNTPSSLFPDMENGNRTVLLEVLLWRI